MLMRHNTLQCLLRLLNGTRELVSLAGSAGRGKKEKYWAAVLLKVKRSIRHMAFTVRLFAQRCERG